MATEITMPKLSDTMTEGLFAGWRKNIGDRIERGDIIAEVETDKAVMELEAFSSGILIKTLATVGELVPVGTVLGLIGTMEELDTATPGGPHLQPEVVVPPPIAAVEPTPAPQPPAVHMEQDHDKASPLVRRLARDKGIDLGQVHGSGPEGRITQDDLLAYSTVPVQQPATAPPAPALAAIEPPQLPSSDGTTVQPISSMRQAISAAVTHSWQTIPHFSVTMEIEMGACREVISELKGGSHALGYNTLLIKGCALALKQFPLLCSSGNSENGMHINIAVALPDGLLMPTIRDCDTLSLSAIEAESARLIEKCRAGRLTSEELSSGVFSISNLGMFGVDEFTALIMPGQTAILAFGAITERAVVRNGQLTVAPTVRVTLSSDHRSVDGAYAAHFLAELRTILEKPVALMVERL